VRLMRSQGRVIQDLPTVRVSAQNIQKGSLNDPVLQGGVFYFDATKTSYLYLDESELWFQPSNSTATKLA
jgi:hypothetical protein